MEDKSITLTTDYATNSINMNFSDNLTDGQEIGYILSASFLSYAINQGLSKEEIVKLVSEGYDEFTSDNN
ncbi:hypothetical protein [Lactobacillus psittaci]|uniref:Uncharacterized protein n=1 Tax=Lactobacillus psittaci DSM 15354 TaxID=1122152 RepID=A0A0R1S2Q7_9LACO|nr:hypothetical protein [Lactobacillus psittaci]KRL63292.1 hypothetical protein FC23_GL000862 [Lactobacillus psittaci DSM 15354]